MNTTFAKEMRNPQSDEYALLQRTRQDFPTFAVRTRQINTNPKKDTYKGLTYAYMKMYGGTQKLVEIRFINPLLDAVVDRFGTKDVQYAKVDDTHFSVTAKVEISDQFFGWILGFGKKAKLLYPEDVKEDFKAYMDKIREMY